MDADFVVRYQYAKDCFEESTLEDIEKYSGFIVKGKYILFEFLGGHFALEHPSAQFYTGSGKPIDFEFHTEITLLTYMANKSDIKLQEKLIPYDDFIEDYGQIHNKRIIAGWLDWFASYFNENQDKLAKVAEIINATPSVDEDKVSLSLQLLPRIPVTLVGWKKFDGNQGPKGQIIYDESVLEILNKESCAAFGRIIVDRINGLVEYSHV